MTIAGVPIGFEAIAIVATVLLALSLVLAGRLLRDVRAYGDLWHYERRRAELAELECERLRDVLSESYYAEP